VFEDCHGGSIRRGAAVWNHPDSPRRFVGKKWGWDSKNCAYTGGRVTDSPPPRRLRGRPAEDRIARQREIYAAVGPLLLAEGFKRLSMQRAASAAHVSVGTLYHYFQDKRHLALCGLRPDVLAHRCQEFHQATDHLMRANPGAYLQAFLRFSVDGIVFIRPAVWAAVELGSDTLQQELEAAMGANTREFLEALSGALTTSELRVAGIARFGRLWRRAFFGLVMDRQAPPRELDEGLEALLRGLLPPSVQLRAS
jgi:AcrR family transcriptional regulator